MPELKNLEVLEVSLVDRPANKRRFLLTKREGELAVASEEMIALILESDLENEAEIDEVLKDTPDSAKEALKGALKLYNAHREDLDGAVVKSLLIKSGLIADEEEEEEEEDEGTDAVVKADGTVDLEKVPEHLRPMIESLWKERTEASEEVATLKAEIAKREEEAEMKMYLAKAEGFHLPAENDAFAVVLRDVGKNLPDHAQFLDDLFTKMSNLIDVSKALEESGSTGATNVQSAWDKADQMAKDLVVQEKGAITYEAALDRVMKENRDLANEYIKEGK